MKNRLIIIISILAIFSLNSCKEREARLPISVSSGVDYAASIALSKKINQREERRFRKYIENQDLKFDRSSFGFQYHITKNSGKRIKSNDKVKYSVTVEDLKGNVIYKQTIKTLVVDHQEEIKGMHEGLKLMSEGAEAIFLFPSHQAFGFHGDENIIKSNTPLVYKVKVLKVNSNLNK